MQLCRCGGSSWKLTPLSRTHTHHCTVGCRRSQLLAHQLIWNCNTYVDESPKMQFPLSKKALRLKEAVISQLDGWAEEVYRQEFDFFGKVNNVSGVLLELKTKDERYAVALYSMCS